MNFMIQNSDIGIYEEADDKQEAFDTATVLAEDYKGRKFHILYAGQPYALIWWENGQMHIEDLYKSIEASTTPTYIHFRGAMYKKMHTTNTYISFRGALYQRISAPPQSIIRIASSVLKEAGITEKFASNYVRRHALVLAEGPEADAKLLQVYDKAVRDFLKKLEKIAGSTKVSKQARYLQVEILDTLAKTLEEMKAKQGADGYSALITGWRNAMMLREEYIKVVGDQNDKFYKTLGKMAQLPSVVADKSRKLKSKKSSWWSKLWILGALLNAFFAGGLVEQMRPTTDVAPPPPEIEMSVPSSPEKTKVTLEQIQKMKEFSDWRAQHPEEKLVVLPPEPVTLSY